MCRLTWLRHCLALVRQARTAKFILWLLRALPTINIFLIGLKDDMIFKSVLIEVILLFTGLQISTYFIMRVDRLMMTVTNMLFLLLLGVLSVRRQRIFKYSLLVSDHSSSRLNIIEVLFVSKVATVL